MRRDAMAVVGVGLVLGLAALLFWFAAPSVDPAVDLDRAAASDVGASAQSRSPDARKPPKIEASGDGVAGDAAAEQGTDMDPEVDPARDPSVLKPIRRLLRELRKEQEGPLVPEDATAAQEDAILATAIQGKVKVMDRMRAEVDGLPPEDVAEAARAQLILADGHAYMADFFKDRPVPSYLDEQGHDNFLDALQRRAEDQLDRAEAARNEASKLAQSLPAGHPLRERLR